MKTKRLFQSLLVTAAMFGSYAAQAEAMVDSGGTNSQCKADFTYTIGANGQVSFTNKSTSSSSTPFYEWSVFGENITSNATNPVITFPHNGQFMVSLLVWPNSSMDTSGGGCMAYRWDTITITNTVQAPCTANFTYSGDAVPDLPLEFYSSQSGSNMHWDFGDGTSQTGAYIHTTYKTYDNPGTYKVCLTMALPYTDTCHVCKDVVIAPSTGPKCSVQTYFYQDSSNAQNYFGYASVTGKTPIKYHWDFGDGSTSNLQYPTHTYANSGAYIVCVTITTADSCTASSCDSVSRLAANVTSVKSIQIINPVATSVYEVVQNGIQSIYPNPSFADVLVNLDARFANGTITLVDALGKVVYSEKVTTLNQNINVSQYPAGIYNLRVAAGNSVANERLMIAR